MYLTIKSLSKRSGAFTWSSVNGIKWFTMLHLRPFHSRLSAETGISENTLKSYLKSDSAEPKATNAVAIANALGVSVEYLVTGKNAKGENFSAKTRLAAQIFESLPQNDQDSVMTLLKEMKKHI